MMRHFALFLLASGVINFAQAQWEVGASEAPVNPEPGAFIAGHTRNRKFSGLHDSLFVKAVVVKQGAANLTILTVDCIGLLYPELQAIREAVSRRLAGTGFMAEHIVLSSTHTHAGPDVVGLWGPDPMHSGIDTVYMRFLVRTAAEQVVKAWNGREKVKAEYAVTAHGEDWVVNISQPAELDRSLTVLRFYNKSGTTVATLTNFACHPTFVDAVHDKVSADYISGFYREMDRRFQGVNFFLQGSIGGWVQPEHEPKTFEQAEWRGKELAFKTAAALSRGKKLGGKGIAFHSKVFAMPVENPGFRLMSEMGVIKRQMDSAVQTEIALFEIGEASFATHPGETVPAMSLATKAMMTNHGPKFVMGLGMDAMGYILKPEFFDPAKKIPHADYLCSMSAGIRTGPRVMEIIEELMGKRAAAIKVDK